MKKTHIPSQPSPSGTPKCGPKEAVICHGRSTLLRNGHKNIVKYGVPGPGNPGFNALIRILRRPWFYRVWILQEVAACSDEGIYCGSRSITWSEFCAAINYAFYVGVVFPAGRKTSRILYRLIRHVLVLMGRRIRISCRFA